MNGLNFENEWMRRASVALTIVGVVLVGLLPVLEGLFILLQSDTQLLAWMGFAGALHPMALHIPIGVFMYVIVCEFIRLMTAGRFKIEVDMALLLGALFAVFAAVFGYSLYLTGGYSVSPLMEEHKRDGLLFAMIALAALFTKSRTGVRGGSKLWGYCYNVALSLLLLTLVSAGHHGGELTHGSLSKAWPGAVEADEPKNSAKEILMYRDLVRPIFEDKCVSCHGSEKQKGGLRMDSIEYLRVGGDSGVCLESVNGQQPLLIECLHLPLDDDLRMPPEGKPQLLPSEIELIERWVAQGATTEIRQK